MTAGATDPSDLASPVVEKAQPSKTTAVAEAKTASRPSRRRIGRAVALAVSLVVVAAGAVTTFRVLTRPPELVVVAARARDVSRMLAVTGRVEAERTVLLGPQFGGRITEIVRHEGDRVKHGDILARLADTSAKAEVVQEQAALSSKESDLAQAKRDFARTSALVASGTVAPAELEAGRLSVARATEDVRRLGSILREGRSQLVLLAPFDGTIVRRDCEVGQVVGPQSTVFEIATVDAARASAEVDERYVRDLRPGMLAEILPAAGGDERQAAAVSYVAQAVDPQTGAATVRFAYASPPRGILVGMSVDVNVNVETIKSAITIPSEAVGGAGPHPYVLVVVLGRVVRRDIVVDDWPASLVVVRSGLLPGELVALNPRGATVSAKVRAKVQSDDL